MCRRDVSTAAQLAALPTECIGRIHRYFGILASDWTPSSSYPSFRSFATHDWRILLADCQFPALCQSLSCLSWCGRHEVSHGLDTSPVVHLPAILSSWAHIQMACSFLEQRLSGPILKICLLIFQLDPSAVPQGSLQKTVDALIHPSSSFILPTHLDLYQPDNH